jgi:hypothetical protein
MLADTLPLASTADIGAELPPLNIITQVSHRRIADMMVGAVEGGSTYWCIQINLLSPGDVAPDDQHKGPWYDNPNRYADPDFKIEVVESEPSDEGDGKHIVDQAAIAKGLEVMARKYPSHFADMVGETDDAITADVFLQCVTLGDVVYG